MKLMENEQDVLEKKCLLPHKRHSGDKLSIPQNKQTVSVIFYETIYYPNISLFQHMSRGNFSGTVTHKSFPLI